MICFAFSSPRTSAGPIADVPFREDLQPFFREDTWDMTHVHKWFIYGYLLFPVYRDFFKKMNLSSSKMLAARLGSLGQVYTVTVP